MYNTYHGTLLYRKFDDLSSGSNCIHTQDVTLRNVWKGFLCWEKWLYHSSRCRCIRKNLIIIDARDGASGLSEGWIPPKSPGRLRRLRKMTFLSMGIYPLADLCTSNFFPWLGPIRPLQGSFVAPNFIHTSCSSCRGSGLEIRKEQRKHPSTLYSIRKRLEFVALHVVKMYITVSSRAFQSTVNFINFWTHLLRLVKHVVKKGIRISEDELLEIGHLPLSQASARLSTLNLRSYHLLTWRYGTKHMAPDNLQNFAVEKWRF